MFFFCNSEIITFIRDLLTLYCSIRSSIRSLIVASSFLLSLCLSFVRSFAHRWSWLFFDYSIFSRRRSLLVSRASFDSMSAILLKLLTSLSFSTFASLLSFEHWFRFVLIIWFRSWVYLFAMFMSRFFSSFVRSSLQ